MKPLLNTLLKAVVPVAIGVAVTVLLFRNEIGTAGFDDFSFTPRALVGCLLAVLFMGGRDFGLTWRFHTIAWPQLSWKRSLRVDLMCAFTSAITPSAVGGSAFAIFYLNREGVSLGRASTLTLTTLFLDELFFVVFCPIILLVVPFGELFGSNGHDAVFMDTVQVLFWLVYAGIVVWTTILYLGIIHKPQMVSRLIRRLFCLRWLRRWRRGAFETAHNMEKASAELRNFSRRWWLNVFGATVVSWFSRYLIVNALFWGFAPESSGLLVFCRQFVVWVILMISPTPGGSGVSEWLFTEYYGDLMGAGGLALTIAIAWRIVSYYVYLIAGSLLLPTYFGKRRCGRAAA
ncbi:MAG: lysylphosphatidylglycerol synthase transmembrane domain-containing protein [Bacteroidales bacterium]|nr:lysylphosphatidylglycerol synthase transmembrane domain-containing protein [Bacteroidales bacterium]